MTAEHYAIQNYACPHCRAVFRTAFQRCPLDGHPLEDLVGDPLAGTSFADRYVIEECVGEGGMGRVYRARHQRMSRRFAVKVLFGDHAADSKMQQRLAREAEAASRLSHPNVISVVDFGETDQGLLYLVMDYVDGPTLAQLLEREAPLERERVIRIARDCARGLAHAHGKGLIHRDFKADNVLITTDSGEEVAKIVDFGIAMLNEPSTSRKLTTEGMVLGTPAVMAPEQAVGEKVDHRTDLFSLGIVMYEMLAGVLPFDGSPLEIARQNLASQVPRISARVPGLWVDPDLEALSMALMAKRPEDRPQRAKDVLKALSQIEGESSREFRRAEAQLLDADPLTPIPGAPAESWMGDDSPTEIAPFPRRHPGAMTPNPAAAVGLTEAVPHQGRARGRSNTVVFITLGIIAALLVVGVVVLTTSDGPPNAAATPDAGAAALAASPDAAAGVQEIDGAVAAAIDEPDAVAAIADAGAAAPDAPPKADTRVGEDTRAQRRKRREAERKRREAERKRREAERKRREAEAAAKANANANAEITPQKYSAKFRAVGRRLGELARKDPAKARGLRLRYQIIQNQHALALRSADLRERNYRTLRSIDAKVRAALGD